MTGEAAELLPRMRLTQAAPAFARARCAHRRRAVRHSVQALATAIEFVAALVLASRLIRSPFPVAHETPNVVPGDTAGWARPLNHCALAVQMALPTPPALATATTGVRSSS